VGTARILIYCVSTVFLVSCSRPVAYFTVSEFRQLPAELDFSNSSQNAISYRWYIDNQQVSEEEDMTYLFLHSGRYTVRLEATDGKKTDDLSKELVLAPPDDCIVWMETSKGNMAFRLLEATPIHRNNFLAKVESGYYRNKLFHRVIGGFMIQGGRSQEGIASETIQAEIQANNVHTRGALSAARMPDAMNPQKESSDVEFFIVQGRKMDEEALLNMASEKLLDYTHLQIAAYLQRGGTPQLDMEYTVFGYLIYGDQVIDRIASAKTDINDKPIEDILIQDIKVLN